MSIYYIPYEILQVNSRGKRPLGWPVEGYIQQYANDHLTAVELTRTQLKECNLGFVLYLEGIVEYPA